MEVKKDKFIINLGLFFILLSVLAYSNHFKNEFHFDGNYSIVSNAYIRNIKNLPLFFTDAKTGSASPINQAYRPLTIASFAFDYKLGELNPVQFHITSFALFLLMGVLISRFIVSALARSANANRHTLYSIAFLVMGWFLITPANTEPVNYIFQRSEIFAGIGILASFLLYLKRPRWRKFGLYLLPMAIAALAKLSAITFAPLLFVYIFLFGKTANQKKLWGKSWLAFKAALPAFLTGGALLAFVRMMDSPTLILSDIPRWNYLISQPFSIFYYFSALFAPFWLSLDHGWQALTSVISFKFLIGAVFLAVIAFLIYKTSRREPAKPIAFGLLWFLITLVPTSSIVPFSEIANDHRAFIPYIGLMLAIIWSGYLVFSRINSSQKNKLKPALAMMLITAFVAGNLVLTYQRNKVWATEESIWQDVVKKNPNSSRGLANYASTLIKQNKNALAKIYLKKSIQLNSNYPYSEVGMAVVENNLGNRQAAQKHFQRALNIEPTNQAVLYNYGLWLFQNRQISAAERITKQLVDLDPANINGLLLLMDIYAAERKMDELNFTIGKVLKLDPKNSNALNYQAWLKQNR